MRQQSVRQQSGQDCCPRYIYVPSCSTGCVCILSPVLVTSSMLSIPQVWKCGQWCSIQSLKGLVMTLWKCHHPNQFINTSNQQISTKSNQQINTAQCELSPDVSWRCKQPQLNWKICADQPIFTSPLRKKEPNDDSSAASVMQLFKAFQGQLVEAVGTPKTVDK